MATIVPTTIQAEQTNERIGSTRRPSMEPSVKSCTVDERDRVATSVPTAVQVEQTNERAIGSSRRPATEQTVK